MSILIIKTLKDLLIDVIIEKEKSNYIIGKFGKSKPNSGGSSSKTGNRLKTNFTLTLMLTLTLTLR